MSRLSLPIVLILLMQALSAGQIAVGTLFQSLDDLQPPGVTSVTLPGDPLVTPTEIIAWSAGDGPGGARVHTNFLGLTTMFGDEDGNGLPVDLSDIDALEVGPYTAGHSPNVYDFRFSLGNPVFNAFGLPVITAGDIIQITGIQTWTKVISENAFKAAIGTGASLDVDAYCELSTGEVLVSFKGAGTGSNIISPFSGQPGLVPFDGADIFIIRQPFGLLPAILAYRQSELSGIVNFYYPSYVFSEIVGVEEQPFTTPGNNPWDPTNLFWGGFRPQILWTVEGDEEVFKGVASAPPIGTNFFAIVGGGQGAGFATNGVGNIVATDALAWGPTPLPANSRVTLDTSAFPVPGGTNVILTVRSPAPAGTQFELMAATQLGFGQGLQLPGLGFEAVVLNLLDPVLYLTLTPPISTALTTAPAGPNGDASTIPLTIPVGFGPLDLYFQAFQLPTATLSPPMFLPFL